MMTLWWNTWKRHVIWRRVSKSVKSTWNCRVSLKPLTLIICYLFSVQVVHRSNHEPTFMSSSKQAPQKFGGQQRRRMDCTDTVFSVQTDSNSFQQKLSGHGNLIKNGVKTHRNHISMHFKSPKSSRQKNIVKLFWQMADWYVSKESEKWRDSREVETAMRYILMSAEGRRGNKRLRSLCTERINTTGMLMQRERQEPGRKSCRYSLV